MADDQRPEEKTVILTGDEVKEARLSIAGLMQLDLQLPSNLTRDVAELLGRLSTEGEEERKVVTRKDRNTLDQLRDRAQTIVLRRMLNQVGSSEDPNIKAIDEDTLTEAMKVAFWCQTGLGSIIRHIDSELEPGRAR